MRVVFAVMSIFKQFSSVNSVHYQPGSANSSQRNSFSSASGQAKPLPSPSSNQPAVQPNIIIFGHDVDSVDIATRVAMVRAYVRKKLFGLIVSKSHFRCDFLTRKTCWPIFPSTRERCACIPDQSWRSKLIVS
jgi:hypothetical protein